MTFHAVELQNFDNVILVCDRHIKASEDVFEKRTLLNSLGH